MRAGQGVARGIRGSGIIVRPELSAAILHGEPLGVRGRKNAKRERERTKEEENVSV